MANAGTDEMVACVQINCQLFFLPVQAHRRRKMMPVDEWIVNLIRHWLIAVMVWLSMTPVCHD